MPVDRREAHHLDPAMFDDDFSPLQSSADPAVGNGLTHVLNADQLVAGQLQSSSISPSAAGPTAASLCSPQNECDTGYSHTNGYSKRYHEEPEVIKQWKRDQVLRLQQKDREEERAKGLLRDHAKKELEDWYKQHAEQMAKLQAAHRAASESTERELASNSLHQPIPPGSEWERVAKLCDFNPKAARNFKDVSRMRSVILQLKQGSLPPPSCIASSSATSPP